MHVGDIVVCTYDLLKAIYDREGDLVFHDQLAEGENGEQGLGLCINSFMVNAIKDMAFLEISEGVQKSELCSAIICRDRAFTIRRTNWVWPKKHLEIVPNIVLKKAEILESLCWSNYPNT